ncbi:battenin CLN3 protein [Desmophyllum pertusum]|uniref:Battenin CLN3 protein n=1 Tax=Desmophyllum pertusum TaxID=174260 RepID=A0A9X0CRH5_9CNID|nr:battenin CLN3 protein [Desmophyllum pertusum]
MAETIVVRLLGFAAVEIAKASIEVTSLSLTVFYRKGAIEAFAGGSGVANILGTLYYTGVSTWTCVSPRITVAILIPSVFLIVIAYLALDKTPLDQQLPDISFPGVKYNTINDKENVTCSSMGSRMQIKKTWILALASIAMMFFLVFASWYRFISEVAIILALCFFIGVLTTMQYSNAPLIVAEIFTDVTKKEFALGLLTLGLSAGLLSAQLMGLYVEPYLKRHCLDELGLGKVCFTRFSNDTGWVENLHCN